MNPDAQESPPNRSHDSTTTEISETLCNFSACSSAAPFPRFCFPIVIGRKALKKREGSVGVQGELQERRKLEPLHLVGVQFGGGVEPHEWGREAAA